MEVDDGGAFDCHFDLWILGSLENADAGDPNILEGIPACFLLVDSENLLNDARLSNVFTWEHNGSGKVNFSNCCVS